MSGFALFSLFLILLHIVLPIEVLFIWYDSLKSHLSLQNMSLSAFLVWVILLVEGRTCTCKFMSEEGFLLSQSLRKGVLQYPNKIYCANLTPCGNFTWEIFVFAVLSAVFIHWFEVGESHFRKGQILLCSQSGFSSILLRIRGQLWVVCLRCPWILIKLNPYNGEYMFFHCKTPI